VLRFFGLAEGRERERENRPAVSTSNRISRFGALRLEDVEPTI